jgi:hypothetical protein
MNRFSRGLDRVTVPAERLPVGFVPEQRSVAAMRDDVVEDGRWRSKTHSADGMATEVGPA